MPSPLILAAVVLVPAADGGMIRGRVIDTSPAALPGAVVRIIRSDSNKTVSRFQADEAGGFVTGDLEAGTYHVVAWVPGFRAGWRREIVVRQGEVTDLGDVRLDLGRCDAPGVICDNFGIGPPDRIVRKDVLTLMHGCSARFRNGQVICQGMGDLRMTTSAAGTYLAVESGAALSAVNPMPADCRDAKFGENRIRIDGLGPGHNFCVRLKDKRTVHVFFVDDVEPMASEARLWCTLRR